MPLQTPEEPKVYTTVYKNFKGVDFTADQARVYNRRTPDAVNILPDDGGIPYKRTGWKKEYVSTEKKQIREMWSFEYGGKEHFLYAKGSGVYSFNGTTETKLLSLTSESSETLGIYFASNAGNSFLMLADQKLKEYKELTPDNYGFADIEPYVPLILDAKAPNGGGTQSEYVNLLTRRRKEQFLADGKSTDYYVSSAINSNEIVVVEVKNSSGVYETKSAGTDYTVGAAECLIKFTTAPANVVTGEGDDVRITYTAAGTNVAADFLKSCTVATVYDRRVFFSGASGDYKSYVWYSAYANARYIPDLSYFVVGDDFTSIMGLIDLGEYLGVIKESTPENSTIYLAYAMSFENDTAYAVKQSISGVGAKSKHAFNSLNGEQLFLSDDGIYGISAERESESSYTAVTSVKNRSYYINNKMLKEPGLDKAISTVWKGFYILCVNGNCYLMDGAQKNSWTTDRTNLLYECYYWENVPATAFVVRDDHLWFGTANGDLCRFKTAEEDKNEAFNDNGDPIPCKWTTVLDNDGLTQYFKNLQKKGNLITVQPMDVTLGNTSVEVYVKADDNEPLYIGSFAGFETKVPQEIYLRKKIKKYKRLQIIVENNMLNESFGVSEIVKMYTIGNYSKNKGGQGLRTYTFIIDEKDDLYINGLGVSALERTQNSETGIITLKSNELHIEYDPESGELYYYE